MPDDMLEDAINIAKKTLDEHDFESQGVEVSSWLGSNTVLAIDCINCKETYG